LGFSSAPTVTVSGSSVAHVEASNNGYAGMETYFGSNGNDLADFNDPPCAANDWEHNVFGHVDQECIQ
jgi:hypothetical protein